MLKPLSTTLPCLPSRQARLTDMPFLGVGLGYRGAFHHDLLANQPRVDFVELMLEHFIDMPPERMRDAELLAARFAIVIHGLDLSLGTIEPLRGNYLAKMRDLAAVTGAHWVSDHLSLTGVPGRAIGNLTPLPLSHKMAGFVARKCRDAVSFLPLPFLLENISVLFRPGPDEMTEQEFIAEVLEESGAFLLLDLTNVFNNATNQNFDARAYLDDLPLGRVVQIHLAGGLVGNGVLLDTHDAPVPVEVLELLRYVAPRMPALRAVMIERDQEFPAFEELLAELDAIREILRSAWAPHFVTGVAAVPGWLKDINHVH